MTRILITRALPDSVVARAESLFDVELRDRTTPMSRAEMRASLALYDGVLPTLGDAYDARVFDGFEHPRCRVLANFGVGYNHIDVEAARAAGVTVTNTPGAVTDATADIAMTLILMTCRRAGEGDRLVRSGTWEGWHPTQMLGTHVTGRKLGIAGFGRIGEAIARRCHFGFGMEVLFHNRSAKTPDFPARQVDSLAELATESDILVCALPGGAETRHMIDADILAAMRPEAHFVNISRGDVVDQTALIGVLEAGLIRGAGLDVYEDEPEVPERLRRLENAVLLPHLGTAALEVREAMGHVALDNLAAFFAGETPPDAV
ncbi:D-glycerate dehydrogenase [Aquicoccus sp. SCR17]|nr:D-glycerate dehydrogenase [Carideicomes alvinocaridis]